MENRNDDTYLHQIADLQIHKDRMTQDYKRLFSEHNETKTDNIQMCQIIREYEEKVLCLEQASKEDILTFESEIKIIKSDKKTLHIENKKLINQ
jgi:predicted GIY-YIG superfamily endonuclease